MTVLQEVVTWFDQPQLLVEMFVNFDMDRKFVSHWNVFSHLVGGVSQCVVCSLEHYCMSPLMLILTTTQIKSNS
jgi:predicted benzoate:H+ symporter BenE